MREISSQPGFKGSKVKECYFTNTLLKGSDSGQPLIFQFNSLQLSQFSAVTWAEMQNTLLIQASYVNHFQDLTYRKCCGQWDIWVEAMGQWLNQDGTSEQYGYNDTTGGVTFGVDKCYKNFLVGGAFSYTYTYLKWDQSAGNSQINSYYGGLYGNWNNDLVYVNTSLLGGFSQYDTTRHFPNRRTGRNANSDHNGGELLVGVESGAIFKKLFIEVDLIPFASVDYVYLAQQAYSETGGGGSNLRVSSRNDQLFQTQVGIEFARRFLCGEWMITPNLALSYVNQSPITSSSLDVTVISLSHEFSVEGWDFARNLGELSFSLGFIDCNGITSISLRYDGQYGGNYWTQTGSLMFNLHF